MILINKINNLIRTIFIKNLINRKKICNCLFMKDIKISKKQLILLLEASIERLESNQLPGEEQEKQSSINFIKNFTILFQAAEFEYIPMSEIISLLVLENQSNQIQLKTKLQKNININNISKKIRENIKANNQKEILDLCKIFDKLNN